MIPIWLKSKKLEIRYESAYMWLIPNYCMPQLQISSETMSRIKEIVGITQVHDGDFMVNEMINILEKKIKDRS